MGAAEKAERRTGYLLILGFTVLALGIVAGGIFYYRHYQQQFRAGVEHQLSAIAKLKADELARYRKERMGDGGIFLNNDGFSVLVKRFLTNTNPEDVEAQRQIQEWADKFVGTAQYDHVRLLDVQGSTRLSSPVGLPPVAFAAQRIPDVLRTNQVTFQDLRRKELDQLVYLGIMVPIFEGQDVQRPLGVFYLRIDPEKYLYPFIRRWPTPSPTAETLLVRRDGNDALFLNELKFRTNTALNLRISLEQTNVPAVRAVLGQTGIMQGLDYRQVPVIAALCAISDSPWFLVAKMDLAEVYAPLRERLRLTILLVSLLVLGVGLGGGIFWRQQRVRFYKERSQVAEALRESEERFRRVFEEGPIGMTMLDQTFHFIRVNPAFSAMLEYPMDEMQTMAFPDITHPDQVQKDVEEAQRLLRGELSVYRAEKRCVTRSGKELWGLMHVSVVRTADGTFRYFLAIISNITERKRAEDELRRAHDELERRVAERTAELDQERFLLQAIMDNVPDNIYFKDRESRLIRINRAKAQSHGVSDPAQVVGKTDFDFFTDEHARQAYEDEQAIIRTGQPMTKEEKETWPDRPDTWVSTIKMPLRDDGGNIIGTFGISRDITGRKQMEEALRQSRDELEKRVAERTAELRRSNAFLDSIIENLPNMLFLKDAKTLQFVRFNRAGVTLLGCTEADVLGKTDHDFFSKELADQFTEQDRQVLRGKEMVDIPEEPLQTRDKGRRILHTRKVPILNAAGEPEYLLGISEDITGRKQASEALAAEQRLLNNLITAIPDLIYFKDRESRFTRINEAFARRNIFSDPAVALGKTDFDLFGDQHARQAYDDEQQIMATGRPIIGKEEREDWKDGRVTWVSSTKVPLYDGGGKIVGIMGISRDITEHKRAEQALRESQALYHSLVEQMPAGVFRKDPEGRYVLVNSVFCRLQEVTPDQYLGKTALELKTVNVALAAQGASHHVTIMQSGIAIEVDEIFTRADGEIRNYHAVKTPVLDSAGKIVGSQGILFDVTEQKRVEEALRLNQERLLKVITQTRCILNFGQVEGPDGWRERALNPASPFRWDFPVQNEEAAQKVVPLELASGERYQQAWTRSRNRDDNAQMNWNSGNAFLNDLPFYRNEFRCTDKNGAGHWMQQFVTVRKLAENRWEIFGITTDITDLKRIETQLRESQALYHSLVEQMPAGVFRKDPEGHYIFVNSVFCRIKETTPDQYLGKTALELEVSDVSLAARGAGHHATIMQSGSPIVEDEVYHRTDGEIRNYQVVKSPVFDAAGKIVGTQGILFDITERKRVEEALHRSETELEATLESTADGILAVDNTGKVIKANRRFAEIWRIPRPLMDAGDERALLDFVLKQLSDPDAFLKKVQSLYNSDAVDMDTLAFKDGRMFERYSFPMTMEGAVIGRVWSFRDITERKRQEEELKQKNTELERFTYTVSHDLKSPLVTVKTFLGYLEQDLARPDPERVKQDVAYMHTAAEKMSLLLDELLNLARIGRKSNPAVRVTFQELAQEVVGLVAGRISAGGVQVQVADAVVTLEGDRPRLMEIWQNLVENACKFMGNQPHPQVELGVEQRGLETVFFVRDNGAGIEPRFQAKVFGLFEKLDPKGEGTGMGLALVKRIVELYRGRIWVESAGPGQGAKFLFTLPGAVIIEA